MRRIPPNQPRNSRPLPPKIVKTAEQTTPSAPPPQPQSAKPRGCGCNKGK